MSIDLKDRLYTSSEVAEILGVSLRSVYRYIEEGKLDADIKTATGRHRFSRKNILDFLKPGESNSTNDYNSNSTFSARDINPTQNNVVQTTSKDDFDFDFDFDDEFLKSLDSNAAKGNEPEFSNNKSIGSNNGENITNANFGNTSSNDTVFSSNNGKALNDFDDLDDLEKLLREFEEEEVKKINDFKSEDITSSDSSYFTGNNYSNTVNNYSKNQSLDDDDLSLDEILKSFESEGNNSISGKNDSQESSPKKSNIDDDFDFDFDDLDSFFDEKPKTPVQDVDTNTKARNYSNDYTSNRVADDNRYENKAEVEEEDNWLERFRKAASKNTQSESHIQNQPQTQTSQSNKNFLDDVFSKNINNFSNYNSAPIEPQINSDLKEMYYTSSLNDLREIAQQVDKVAKKFETDYAFTLNAGLSLHKKIDPFSVIHLYIRDRDLELFEDYLDLSPSNKSDSSVCLMVTKNGSVFEDSYELHGLYVVSNVQLRSDLIDKGLDRLAREI